MLKIKTTNYIFVRNCVKINTRYYHREVCEEHRHIITCPPYTLYKWVITTLRFTPVADMIMIYARSPTRRDLIASLYKTYEVLSAKVESCIVERWFELHGYDLYNKYIEILILRSTSDCWHILVFFALDTSIRCIFGNELCICSCGKQLYNRLFPLQIIYSLEHGNLWYAAWQSWSPNSFVKHQSCACYDLTHADIYWNHLHRKTEESQHTVMYIKLM